MLLLFGGHHSGAGHNGQQWVSRTWLRPDKSLRKTWALQTLSNTFVLCELTKVLVQVVTWHLCQGQVGRFANSSKAATCHMLVLVLLHTRLVHTVLELVFVHTVLVVRALQTALEPSLTTYLMLSTAAPFVGVWQQHFLRACWLHVSSICKQLPIIAVHFALPLVSTCWWTALDFT